MRLKPSQYNLITHRGDRSYLFNTNSLSSLSLNRAIFSHLFELLREVAETGNISTNAPAAEQALRILREHRFVIDSEIDEMAEIRQRYTRACTDNTLRLTIVPTVSCNMHCHYCYEGTGKNSLGWKLKGEQWRRVAEFADQRLRPEGKMIVHWFGGEPLLQKQAIYRVSESLMVLAERKGASYEAWITTNGYNLDSGTAAKLRDCNVKKVQVTFDGSKPYHDQVRFVGNERIRRSSYDRLMDNILAASDFLRFVVRLHVAPSNLDSFQELVEDLAAKGLPAKVAYAAVHLIESFNPHNRHTAHQSEPERSFSTREFALLEAGLLRILHEHGFKLRSQFAYATGCMVDEKNSYLIDADGSIKQCDHYVGDPASGYSHLNAPDIITNMDNLTRWNVDRFASQECLDCGFFPVCLRGCLHKVIDYGESDKDCPTIRYNWQDVLPFFYDVKSHY
jgi:uncharacterized protein